MQLLHLAIIYGVEPDAFYEGISPSGLGET